MESTDDIALCKLTVAGNDEAFARLVERYSGLVYSIIVRIANRQEEAEELTQDVFLKVYKSLKGYKGDCRFSTWLYRIAYNTAVSACRKRHEELIGIDETTLANVTEEEVDDALNRTDNSEMLERLDRAVNKLEAGDRAIITLFYMDGHSIEEVAEITGLSAANIKIKLHRIRKKLYIWISQERMNG